MEIIVQLLDGTSDVVVVGQNATIQDVINKGYTDILSPGVEVFLNGRKLEKDQIPSRQLREDDEIMLQKATTKNA